MEDHYRCIHCQCELNTDERYCHACGGKQECPNPECHNTDFRTNGNFCSKCGTKLPFASHTPTTANASKATSEAAVPTAASIATRPSGATLDKEESTNPASAVNLRKEDAHKQPKPRTVFHPSNTTSSPAPNKRHAKHTKVAVGIVGAVCLLLAGLGVQQAISGSAKSDIASDLAASQKILAPSPKPIDYYATGGLTAIGEIGNNVGNSITVQGKCQYKEGEKYFQVTTMENERHTVTVADNPRAYRLKNKDRVQITGVIQDVDGQMLLKPTDIKLLPLPDGFKDIDEIRANAETLTGQDVAFQGQVFALTPEGFAVYDMDIPHGVIEVFDAGDSQVSVGERVTLAGTITGKHECTGTSWPLMRVSNATPITLQVDQQAPSIAKSDVSTTNVSSPTGGDEATAMYKKGLAYESARDYNRAYNLYQRAAEAGNADAVARIGILYFHGTGVPKDPVQEVTMYKKAADLGSAEGRNHLGVCYLEGVPEAGIEKDYAKAAELLQASAGQNSMLGQYNLARCYENGWGVPVDLQQAAHYYELSAAQGSATAKHCLNAVRKKMQKG